MKKRWIRLVCIILAVCFYAVLAMGSSPSGGETESTQEETEEQVERTYTIADEIIVDNEYCTFKIVKAEVDELWGFQLRAFCENKTEDKTLMFTLDGVSVNGYMCDPFYASEVASGKKSNGTINFYDFLEEMETPMADEIVFTLRVYNSDDWSEDDIVNERFVIYPTGLSEDEIEYPERRTTETEKVLVDDENITIVVLDTEVDDFWGYTVNCYFENKTDKLLMFSWDDVSVNGFMIDPFFAARVTPGMRCYTSASFSDSDFEENGITSVEEIEFLMRVFDYDDWFADALYSNVETYKP